MGNSAFVTGVCSAIVFNCYIHGDADLVVYAFCGFEGIKTRKGFLLEYWELILLQSMFRPYLVNLEFHVGILGARCFDGVSFMDTVKDEEQFFVSGEVWFRLKSSIYFAAVELFFPVG